MTFHQEFAPSRRPLDGLEKAFWLLDQNRPTHFSMIAEIEGVTQIEDWRKALEAIGRQSPIVASQIVVDEVGEPYLEVGSPRAIPMSVATKEGGWQAVVAAELLRPFDTVREALVRGVLIPDGSSSTFILTSHHSVTDGPSASFLLRDILHTIGGDGVVLPIGTDSLEVAVSRTGLPSADFMPTDTEPNGDAPGYRPAGSTMPGIDAQRLSTDQTSAVRSKAREEHATVQGALCAAASRVFRSLQRDGASGYVRVFSPIDVRRRLLGGAENLGVYVSGLNVGLAETAPSFWDDARIYSARLSAISDPDLLAFTVLGVRVALHDVLSPDVAAAIWAHVFGAEVTMTNLGAVDFPSRFGELKLNAFWGPAVSLGIADEQTVGVVTFDNQMHLLHSSHEPIEGFLSAVVATLLEA